MRVAFLGLGRMGAAMARHVPAAGHELTVWNRTPGRADTLVDAGARVADTVSDAVADADVVAMMLFGPAAVREVLVEVTAAASPGTLVVDATTSSPADVRGFAATCAAAGLRYVEAPVVGSLAPAADGSLAVLAGGSEQDYTDALAVLRLWGDPAKVRRLGEVGAGSAMKLCNNLALAYSIAGVGEALRLGVDLGIEPTAILDALAPGALGWMINYKKPMLASGDYSATTFSLELLAKDIDLAVQAADRDLPLARAVLSVAREAVAAGNGGQDFAALAGHLAGHRAAADQERERQG